MEFDCPSLKAFKQILATVKASYTDMSEFQQTLMALAYTAAQQGYDAFVPKPTTSSKVVVYECKSCQKEHSFRTTRCEVYALMLDTWKEFHSSKVDGKIGLHVGVGCPGFGRALLAVKIKYGEHMFNSHKSPPAPNGHIGPVVTTCFSCKKCGEDHVFDSLYRTY